MFITFITLVLIAQLMFNTAPTLRALYYMFIKLPLIIIIAIYLSIKLMVQSFINFNSN